MPKKEQFVTKRGWIFGVMLAFGIAALIASFALTQDKFTLLENPDAVLDCSVNVVLNCSKVMETWQSHVFGFPNMLIGMMAFPVVITLAVAGLSRTAFPRRFLIAAEICIIAGTLFAYWLFFNSVYAIQILCPWCLVVTFSCTMITAAITYFNLSEGHLFPKQTDKIRTWLKKGYYQMIVAAWIVLLIALVFLKFGSALFA
jgi:uncharacterized membrane protein